MAVVCVCVCVCGGQSKKRKWRKKWRIIEIALQTPDKLSMIQLCGGTNHLL